MTGVGDGEVVGVAASLGLIYVNDRLIVFVAAEAMLFTLSSTVF